MFFFGSAHYVKIKGKRAKPREAPILIGGPHTSFFDVILVVLSGPGSAVAKYDAKDIPFYGSTFFNNSQKEKES